MTNYFWSSEDDDLLKTNYTVPKEKLQALFPDRSWSSVKQRMNKLGYKRKNKSWSSEDEMFMTRHYYDMPTSELAKHLNRSDDAIRLHARVLGLEKSNQLRRNSNCKKLLDESLESLYWIGFIYADGHISNTHRLIITLSIQDRDHLEQFAKYVESSNVTFGMSGGTYPNCSIKIQDADNLSHLSEKYDINPQKTYNPPNTEIFKALSDEQKLALIIGFIDGDGSIKKLNRKMSPYNISIKNHASWLEMHKQIVGFLISHFDLESKMTAKINRSGYTHFTITYSDIIHGLKEFAINNKLPYMSRKWNIISPQVRVRNKMKISQIREVKKMYKSGVKIYKLADMFGVSYSLIERVVNKEY